MREEPRERRDWSVILILLLLGVLLMLFAGQRAIQLISHWTVRADMSSNLNPNLPAQVAAFSTLIQPVKAGILTPAPWNGTFLTPGAGTGSGTVEPLLVFNPSSTPAVTVTTSPTAAPPTSTQATGTSNPTSTSTATTWTATPKPTKKPNKNPPPTVTSTATSIATSTSTSTSTSTATSTATSTPPPAVVSTIDPSLTKITGTPAGFNLGAPDGNSAQGSNFPDGSYFVVDLGTNTANQVHVDATPNGHYGLVYYEVANPQSPPPSNQQIFMDRVIVGISTESAASHYYQVFNWGDGTPDTNTNVDTTKLVPPVVPSPVGPVPTSEVDNQNIPTNVLYNDPSNPTSPPASTNLQTGILINVDKAPSNPPAGDYQYIVVIAPTAGSSDGGQVDSIQVTQVASPTPP